MAARLNGSLCCMAGTKELYRVQGGIVVVLVHDATRYGTSMLGQVRTATYSRKQYIAGGREGY